MTTEPQPEQDNVPAHYTREPFWMIPVSGLGFLAIASPFFFVFIGWSPTWLGIALFVFSCIFIGSIGSAPLIFRTWIRSPFWSRCLLCGTVLMIPIILVGFLAWLIPLR